MNSVIVQLFVAAVVAFVVTSAETIQLQPTQGILIPAPIAQSMRFARAAYGGGASSAPSYGSAPAQSYSAPAAPSYSAPAPSYSAPAAAQSYSAPKAPSHQPTSIPVPPCSNNYLFSCQPALTPVPCSAPRPTHSAPSYSAPAAPAPSYSAPQAAYSHYIPQYAVPVVRELY